MPEELTPGVHVGVLRSARDEVGARSRTIEGVGTSTFGVVGETELGPVAHPAIDTGRATAPVLVTGMSEYVRVFGGFRTGGGPCPVAHAARLFFENGGRRLYVQRAFSATDQGVGDGPDGDLAGVDLPVGGPTVARWRARWPGAAGARIRIVTNERPGDPSAVDVEIHLDGRVETYADLAVTAGHERFVATVLRPDDPPDAHGLVWLEIVDHAPEPDALLAALRSPGAPGIQLVGGSDGRGPTPDALAAGLAALGDVEDVSLVALPDAGTLDVDASAEVAALLVAHCEQHQYRLALVDPPRGLGVDEVLEFRHRFDSSRAAIYYPWLLVDEPLAPSGRPGRPPGRPRRPLAVAPSGAVAGICARVDLARGVQAPPANERVLGITGLAAQVSTAEQERLNPAGINAIRSFPDRGTVVWGARTMTSDPEWKYVNVRRLFAFLEHSIDRGTQWAVFEPNGERLWASIRRAVEDFLHVQWQTGALLGRTPDEAFFVRCDRTTMTQNDLDNGRLVVLIGVSAVRPAEFVVLRIGQWTADASS